MAGGFSTGLALSDLFTPKTPMPANNRQVLTAIDGRFTVRNGGLWLQELGDLSDFFTLAS
jgi:hypothetical protein